MSTLFSFIGSRHELWLVALAAILCSIGIKTGLRLANHALAAQGAVRLGWIFLVALITGTAMWSTHFVSILAFHPHAEVRHEPVLTVLSLLVGIVGSLLGFALVLQRRGGILPALGGALLGLVAAEMHYVGMAGYQIDAPVRWDRIQAFGSIGAAIALAAAAMAALRGQLGPRFGTGAATALLVTAVIELHYVGMFALKVTPNHSVPAAPGGSAALALATAAGAGLIMAAGALAYMIDARTRDEARQGLEAAALVDALTGLANNHGFVAEVERRVASAAPAEQIAILAMQIANIGAIHQCHGGTIIDRVILATANRLLGARQQAAFVARIAGALYFGIDTVADRAEVLERARKIQEALSRNLLIEGTDIAVDVRVGGAIFPADADSADTLVRKAQAALALALSDPLQPIVLHDERAAASSQRQLALRNDLRGALDRGEFELFYQPQVRIADNRTIGYEALLRWHHPQLGLIPPNEFIPLAEQMGSILPLGEWVLRTACAVAASWDDDCRIAVNVSPLQLRQRDLPTVIHETLLATGLPANRLEIELTESLLVEDRLSALHALRRIKALGVRLALDDFGTGYSSMDVLRQFPFDKVKLDKSFVDDLERNPQAHAILHAMLTLGRALQIPVLVEGVESAHQLAILRKEGCNKVQGYLTGRPIPASEIGRNSLDQLSA